jgi:hypothetical protein
MSRRESSGGAMAGGEVVCVGACAYVRVCSRMFAYVRVCARVCARRAEARKDFISF